MSDALIQLRINQLKAMDEFVHSINNEELMEDCFILQKEWCERSFKRQEIRQMPLLRKTHY